MYGRHLSWLMEDQALVKEVQADRVALPTHQLHQGGSGIDTEKQLVGMFEVNLVADRETHAGALVDDELAAKVGLFLVAFHEELLRSSVELPVDMTNRLARVVEPVFGELHGEAVERTLVKACDEAFHNLSRQKLKTPKLGEPIPIDRKIHSNFDCRASISYSNFSSFSVKTFSGAAPTFLSTTWPPLK